MVEKTKNAIGVISVTWITDDLKSTEKPIEERFDDLEKSNSIERTSFTNKIKVLEVSTNEVGGHKPYQQYIYDGSYPLVREIFAIDASGLHSTAHAFYSFITGSMGQKIIMMTGISAAAVPVRVVNVGGNN